MLDKCEIICIIKSVTITDFYEVICMKHYSRQREAILNVLRATDTHPTAGWIYEKVREIIPNISLGTVYRNLTELSQSGEILSINLRDGQEHYDGDNSPHLHLRCSGCSSISDVVLNNDPLTAIAKERDFIPDNSVYVIYGKCKNCINK